MTRIPRLIATASLLLSALAFGRSSAQDRASPQGAYRIAGTIVNAKAGNPLGRARVTITPSDHPHDLQTVITGDDGRFEFHLPAGRYALGGEKRGYISANYDQHEQFSTAIVTGAEVDTENLVLRLAPDAVLSGRVLDEFGEPARYTKVTVYRESRSQGVGRILRFRTVSTNDLGRYEVGSLAAGTYFVSAEGSPWYAVHAYIQGEDADQTPPPRPAQTRPAQLAPQVDPSLDVAYPITYFGDATESDDAVPIPVRGGDRLEADIHLTPVPALHMMVRLAGNDGTLGFPSLQKPAFDTSELVMGNVQGLGDGLYELTGIAPGRYSLQMRSDDGDVGSSPEVNLSSGDLDLSGIKPAATITAAVQVEGAAELPEDLQVLLRDSKGRISSAAVDGKGQAHFSNLAPGKYEATAASSTNRYAVTRIATEKEVIPGHVITVNPGVPLMIALSLVSGSVTVEGVARRNGKAAAGAMVVLVPQIPESNWDRFRRDQSDLDGSFRLRDVVPGTYFVVAIQDGWDLDWGTPSVIAAYVGKGKPVDVEDKSGTMRLPDAVEAQGR